MKRSAVSRFLKLLRVKSQPSPKPACRRRDSDAGDALERTITDARRCSPIVSIRCVRPSPFAAELRGFPGLTRRDTAAIVRSLFPVPEALGHGARSKADGHALKLWL